MTAGRPKPVRRTPEAAAMAMAMAGRAALEAAVREVPAALPRVEREGALRRVAAVARAAMRGRPPVAGARTVAPPVRATMAEPPV